MDFIREPRMSLETYLNGGEINSTESWGLMGILSQRRVHFSPSLVSFRSFDTKSIISTNDSGSTSEEATNSHAIHNLNISISSCAAAAAAADDDNGDDTSITSDDSISIIEESSDEDQDVNPTINFNLTMYTTNENFETQLEESVDKSFLENTDDESFSTFGAMCRYKVHPSENSAEIVFDEPVPENVCNVPDLDKPTASKQNAHQRGPFQKLSFGKFGSAKTPKRNKILFPVENIHKSTVLKALQPPPPVKAAMKDDMKTISTIENFEAQHEESVDIFDVTDNASIRGSETGNKTTFPAKQQQQSTVVSRAKAKNEATSEASTIISSSTRSVESISCEAPPSTGSTTLMEKLNQYSNAPNLDVFQKWGFLSKASDEFSMIAENDWQDILTSEKIRNFLGEPYIKSVDISRRRLNDTDPIYRGAMKYAAEMEKRGIPLVNYL